MDDNNLKERDFHRYRGWQVPFVIKVAWTLLLAWIVIYFTSFVLPNLKAWLNR